MDTWIALKMLVSASLCSRGSSSRSLLKNNKIIIILMITLLDRYGSELIFVFEESKFHYNVSYVKQKTVIEKELHWPFFLHVFPASIFWNVKSAKINAYVLWEFTPHNVCFYWERTRKLYTGTHYLLTQQTFF